MGTSKEVRYGRMALRADPLRFNPGHRQRKSNAVEDDLKDISRELVDV